MSSAPPHPSGPAEGPRPLIPERSSRNSVRCERLITLSDCVFAFAITLLALSLVVPVLSKDALQIELMQHLMGMWPAFLSYFVSFFVIAGWWGGHHQIFSCIRRCNSTIKGLNFYFLLCITIIPFLTNLIVTYWHFALATVLYAAMQAITGTVLLVMWIYAARDHRLIDPDLNPRKIRLIFHRSFWAICIFLFSIPIALFSTPIAQISWIAIPPIGLIVQRAYEDAEEFLLEQRQVQG